VLAAVQVGAEVRAPREQRAGALSDARASAARP
jgi:hypothetical protein